MVLEGTPGPGAIRAGAHRRPWKVLLAQLPPESAPEASTSEKLDDDDYPAYTMGRAAELVGVTQAFLRSLGAAGLITPQRSGGGHRRYSRRQLQLAERARELVDQGTSLEAVCRILVLEDQLAEARRVNAEYEAREH